MTTQQYVKLAQQRAAFMALSRLVQERYLPIEGADEPEMRVEAEDLPRNESEVSQEVWVEMAAKLNNLAAKRQEKMSGFRFVEASDLDEQEWETAVARKGSPAKTAENAKQGAGESSAPRSEAPANKRPGSKSSVNPRARGSARGKP